MCTYLSSINESCCFLFVNRSAKTSRELHRGHVAEAARCSGCHPEQHLHQVQPGGALSGLVSLKHKAKAAVVFFSHVLHCWALKTLVQNN